jgi:hypothetical protein
MLTTSILEGVSATLPAVTWNAESNFSSNRYSNPNDGAANNADVGLMQINYGTFNVGLLWWNPWEAFPPMGDRYDWGLRFGPNGSCLLLPSGYPKRLLYNKLARWHILGELEGR